MTIHPSAIIDPLAEIHPEAEIGPYVVVDGPVRIGRKSRVMAHATILGWSEIGEENEIHPGVILGDAPQDTAYRGEETYLRIGNHNVLREYVQVHRGTAPGSSTVIGNHNFLMVSAHVAHNCRLGDHIVMANGALLGGYVEVGDRAFISAHCLVHQFVRVGELSLMRGLSGTSRDVPPYSIIDWQHTVRGVNVVGLKRAGFDERRIRKIREAFRILFRKGRNLSLAIKEIESNSEISTDLTALLEFIKSSQRGVCFGG
ncbi:MAG: acyl-ACP--UDP-N-acetylglucosamine O-acyltransferase [Deltaproteobacteria bacterium]|nr:acyl-ACP--UDP-N-acetylglucosamine O-acyltransferase [Deltaproteobacteria bacterium]MCZ6562787.1 acyl-ACP--UDP-N-acetylglucosamine O-acyltransferase [Deltaproteobacteria bacterium]MCZ6622436.1 acyl-ACP--UDP-N-acetylglucosamine O-acyltransferase [Deltaproteobacteria bacterium]MCZ6907227.1 acyl-ACP--UDP-N-acetylglucosamine O-acyltransferase [Deltaproteobacteria bacterium]